MHKQSIGIGFSCLTLAVALQSATGRAGDAASATRYEASGSVMPLERSGDGRFAGGGQARFAPESASIDGRFALKSTHAPSGGCAPFPDSIFANGFEP